MVDHPIDGLSEVAAPDHMGQTAEPDEEERYRHQAAEDRQRERAGQERQRAPPGDVGQPMASERDDPAAALPGCRVVDRGVQQGAGQTTMQAAPPAGANHKECEDDQAEDRDDQADTQPDRDRGVGEPERGQQQHDPQVEELPPHPRGERATEPRGGHAPAALVIAARRVRNAAACPSRTVTTVAATATTATSAAARVGSIHARPAAPRS